MADMLLDILPEPIFSNIHTDKVKTYDENGTIPLAPFSEEKPYFEHLIGMFSDGKMSADQFLQLPRSFHIRTRPPRAVYLVWKIHASLQIPNTYICQHPPLKNPDGKSIPRFPVREKVSADALAAV